MSAYGEFRENSPPRTPPSQKEIRKGQRYNEKIQTNQASILDPPESIREIYVSAPCSTKRLPATEPAARKTHLPPLTAIRFPLALWVIAHHLTGEGMMLEGIARSLAAPLQALFRGGWVAVQTFFILSGLVLARSQVKPVWSTAALRRFAIARLARVYPAYLLSLLLVAPFIYATLATGKGHAWPLVHKMAVLTSYLFVLQGWTGSLGVGWNTPAWSLSCELFFYLCFPAIVLLYRKRATQPAPTRTACLLLASFLLPALTMAAGISAGWKPMQHLADFLAGIAAADLIGRIRSRWLTPVSLGLFAAAVAYAVIVESYLTLNTALRPLGVLVLVGLAAEGERGVRWLAAKPFQFLGKASYAMYILHVPLLWWFGRLQVARSLHLSGTTAALLYIGVVVAISSVTFVLIEEPANRLLRRRLTAVRP